MEIINTTFEMSTFSGGKTVKSLRISFLRAVKFTELSDTLSIQSILRPLENNWIALKKNHKFLWPDDVPSASVLWSLNIPSGYWPCSTDSITVPDWCFEYCLHPDIPLFWLCTAVCSQLICKQNGCNVNWSKIFLSNKNGCEPLSYRFQFSRTMNWTEAFHKLCTAVYRQTVYRFTPTLLFIWHMPGPILVYPALEFIQH